MTGGVIEGGGILIDADHPGTGSEEGGAVTTSAKGAVDDETSRCWDEEAKDE